MNEEIDIGKYTQHEAYKALTAIEGHLENFSNAPMFCTACLKKHLAYLEILAEECSPAQCSLNPVYKEIKDWAIKARDSLARLGEREVKELAVKSRDFRKKLEMDESAKHLS